MRDRPPGISDAEVVEAVRMHWAPDVNRVEYLPLGFGAHHWRADRADIPHLFVTLDSYDPRRDFGELRAAYAGASALAAAGLEFVHAALPPYAVPFRGAALSVTPWLDGTTPDAVDPVTTRATLTRLHGAEPPRIPVWKPIVPPNLAAELTAAVGRPWTLGPYGERARTAIADRLSEIDAWVSQYHRRTTEAAQFIWVPTHGEPHAANQFVTPDGIVLVDWESLKLAPPERDLSVVGDGDPAMLEMFDLEWRLDEIGQYATWFAAPHTGNQDDAIAFAGLLHELDRVR